MPSPFPGMNPYIEHPSVWHDFHEAFMPAARDALAAQVRPRYIVKIDEQRYVHEFGGRRRRLLGRADVTVSDSQPRGRAGSAVALEAPVEVAVPQIDVEGVSYLEIRDRDTRDLITVIELLSPTNKNVGPDREQYITKARQVIRSSAHFVEIDLLRGGPRMGWLHMPRCDYCAVVSRHERRPRAELLPMILREPLPAIPIPLRTGDADARLDLQSLVHSIHDAAGYADYIYSNDPEPRLSAKWASKLLVARSHSGRG